MDEQTQASGAEEGSAAVDPGDQPLSPDEEIAEIEKLLGAEPRFLIGVSKQALPGERCLSKKGTFACPDYSVSTNHTMKHFDPNRREDYV